MKQLLKSGNMFNVRVGDGIYSE